MGTKVAPYYPLQLDSGQPVTLKLRLTDIEPLGGMDFNSGKVGTMASPGQAERAEGVPGTNDFGAGFDGLFVTRQKEAEEFYATRISKELSDDAKAVMRQSFSGMLWSKQFYHYDVRTWLEGDPAGPKP
ncbi:MAG: glucosidase, partial [Acidobacteria bacterium]